MQNIFKFSHEFIAMVRIHFSEILNFSDMEELEESLKSGNISKVKYYLSLYENDVKSTNKILLDSYENELRSIQTR